MSQWLSQFSLRTKFISSFVIVFVAAMALGLLTLDHMSGMFAATEQIRTNYLPSLVIDNDMMADVSQLRIKQARMLAADTPQMVADAAQHASELIASFQKHRDAYQSLMDPGEEAAQFQQLDEKWTEYRALSSKFVELINAGDRHGANQLYLSAIATFDPLLELVKWELNYNLRHGTEEANNVAILYAQTRNFVQILLGITAAICIAVGITLIRSTSTPIVNLAQAMRRLANRDMSVAIPGLGRGDEIGQMSSAVEVFRDSMIRADQLAAEQESSKQQAAAAQKAAMNQTADGFEAKVGSLVAALSSAATELQATAESMSSTASRTNDQATSVTAAAENASTGVQAVASACEELAISVREISRQVAESAQKSERAADTARRTDSIVRALAEGASRIGDVVNLITGIAGQTNLLALNATIEAARAGDAGKGFAVVASEVKELASQTARATDEIAQQIGQIQASTKEAVDAIGGISAMIGEVSLIATTIASAVEEQGAATAEIARNVQGTATSTQSVTSTISGVSRAAQETGAAAEQVLVAARDLSVQAEQLRAEVKGFVAEVHAA